MSSPKVLVIAPAFHQYGDAISRAFIEIGYESTSFAYDGLPDLRAKITNKLMIELPSWLGSDMGEDLRTRRATERALAALRSTRPDRVVVVRGDVFDGRFWSELVDIGVPTTVWLYDQLVAMSHDLEHLRSVTAVATYSPNDSSALTAAGIRASTLPLAFDASARFTARPSEEVVFIGAAYPNRVDALLSLHRSGVPIRAYGRDWSHAPFDRLRTWKMERPDLPWGRDIDRASSYGIMSGASAALNLHGVQDGFTMRTFEACGSGALQIIDRPDVAMHFETGTELVAFDSPEERLELCRRAIADRVWRDSIASAGQRRALAEHTFAHRAQSLKATWE